MKNHISSLFRLAIVSLAAFPAYVMAAPTAGSAYYTDVTNSYVQDQTSQVMGNLNNILCYMGAMAPSLMVNAGDYIALVDQNVCESKGSGGQSGNTGSAYTTVVVNSSRASTSVPMTVKAWVSPQPGDNIRVYASATQAPDTTKPYGVFNMNYCGMQGNVCPTTGTAFNVGYIDSAPTGVLTFYSANSSGTENETTQLQLNAPNLVAGTGNGVINEAATFDYNGTPVNLNFKFAFAYDSNYFIRTTDVSGATPQCFDRRPTQAAESVWRYGLYDATSGARINRNSGFPIEYTDSVSGLISNGYIGYYGLWTQGEGPLSDSTVQKVTYNNNGATKTPYTLLKTGGKLMKYTTATKLLPNLNKVTFWYRAPTTLTVDFGSIPSMTGGSNYEIYWNGTTFMVSGQKGVSGNMEPLTTPGSIANAAMVAAHPWGLFGWSQMMGGMFGITGSEFAKLTTTPSTIQVKTQTQDVVYPTDYATALPNGLKCINDCPTAALIITSNAALSTAPSTPFENPGWTAVASNFFKPFTLDGTTGNMLDALSAPVVSDVTSGNNAYGIRSGRMVTPADATAMIAAKEASGVCVSGPCPSFNQGDVDFLPEGSSYYVWETGGQPWNQIAILKNPTSGVPVKFDPPLQVSFTVPTGAKYDSYQGATISLQYGGFGDLWGIPNECIDIATNAACDFTQDPLYQDLNFRWTPDFSIPCSATAGAACDGTAGIVTDNSTTPATTYLAKALDKEVRLRNATQDAPNPCTAAGLTPPAVSILTLSGNFVEPSTNVGTKPTVTTAPKVIHGVKQY